MTTTTFQVGDRVRLKTNDGQFRAGELGTVRGHSRSTGNPCVEFDEGANRGHGGASAGLDIQSGNAWFGDAEAWEHIKVTTSTAKPGDRVRLIRNSGRFRIGETGTVRQSRGTILVEFDSGAGRGHRGEGFGIRLDTDGGRWIDDEDAVLIETGSSSTSSAVTSTDTALLAALKAEIRALPESSSRRTILQDRHFDSLIRILSAAGLEYRRGTPAPIEFEFAPLAA